MPSLDALGAAGSIESGCLMGMGTNEGITHALVEDGTSDCAPMGLPVAERFRDCSRPRSGECSVNCHLEPKPYQCMG